MAAPTLLAEHKPFEALALWFRRIADYARVKRGVFSAVTSGVQRDMSGHSLGDRRRAPDVAGCGKGGRHIRSDVDVRDVILLIGFLSHIEESEADERAHHVLELILDGLRRRADDS